MAVQGFLGGLQVGSASSIDDFDVGDGVDLADDVVHVKGSSKQRTALTMARFHRMCEELVAQALALAGADHQAER